jgi:hypothetical protein
MASSRLKALGANFKEVVSTDYADYADKSGTEDRVFSAQLDSESRTS